MKTKSYLAAVWDAARVIDLPGAPRTLRLDNVEVVGDVGGAGGRVMLSWSFEDPESYEGEPVPHGRRVRGVLQAGPAQGDPRERARSWWAAAQLEAGHRFVTQVDADWLPGQPAVALAWTVQEAWAALLAFLGSYGGEVHVHAGELRVTQEHEEVAYRIDPLAWAEYLNRPYRTPPSEDSYVVPAAVPMYDGLPGWAIDELSEVAGSNEDGVVGLVDGELVGLGP